MNGQSVIDLIRRRTSVRTYSDKKIETFKLADMETYLTYDWGNPFGAKVRFALLHASSAPKRLGTYGLIHGMKVFFAGCVQKGDFDMEGFGFAFERAILYAQSLELETCWLGGTFRRSAFERMMQPNGEILPAASPLGYAAAKKTLRERITASTADARSRKPWNELFFDGDWQTPLQPGDGALKTCLEMVRIAPSASNKQPWRVLKSGDAVHFFLKETPGYTGNKAFGFCMQRIDMGIAACHFNLAANELQLGGEISIEDPELLDPQQTGDGMSYSFTWKL